jgi:hypothetical protein
MLQQIRYQYENLTYVSGPTNQLHTWLPYMERLEQDNLTPGRHFFVHCINQHPIESIYQGFPWQMFTETCAQHENKQIVVILDAHTEGPSWSHINTTVERMISEFGIDPLCIIQWTGSAGEGGEPIQIVTVMDAFTIITSADEAWPERQPRHHFVMLARIPKDHRVLMAIEVLQRKLEKYGYISCGCGNHGELTDWDWRHVPDNLRSRFPLLLPGDQFNMIQTPKFSLDSIQLPEVTGAFCSVIPETTHDLMYPNVFTAFLTEKSEKCFLLEQVPLWVAAPGQVELARQCGFDVFDDLIDHGYDRQADPLLRIKMVADQLERLCAMSLGQLHRYKRNNQDRFSANRNLCFDMRRNHTDTQYHKLVGCINRMNVPAAS